MVFAILWLYPSAKDRGAVLEILRSVQDLTKVRTGCLDCWLLDSDSVHDHIRYGEQWAAEDDLYEHIRSDLYRRVLVAMELSRRAPQVQFHCVSATRGMELIEALRSRPNSEPLLDD